MTTKEFWDKYINEDILEIFDSACDFFSNELPQEFIENYDADEVILEVKGHNETAKEFDRVLKFTKLIQEKQPKLYEENFQYFDDFLVDYHCFHGNKAEVAIGFSNFIINPIHDFDKYLVSFKKILFYQHNELLDKAITTNFDGVSNSSELIGGAEYDLALCKHYLTLELLYEQNNTLFNSDEFLERLNKYGFNFDNDFILSVEQALFKPVKTDNIENAFIHDKQNCIVILDGYFLRYMKDKGFSFPLSGRVWDKMLEFWEQTNGKKKSKPDVYFRVQLDKFEKHLSRLSGSMFSDNESEMIAVLWGSVYIYDFLKSIEIISQETYNDFINVSKILKGKVIGQFTSDLWNSNFVHQWQKPDSISEAEFAEEEKIFRKSISFKLRKFSELSEEISEELDRIGELKKFIVEGAKEDKRKFDTTLLDKVFSLNHEPEDSDDKPKKVANKKEDIYIPVRTEAKIGRNEPCPCGSGNKYKKCCGKD